MTEFKLIQPRIKPNKKRKLSPAEIARQGRVLGNSNEAFGNAIKEAHRREKEHNEPILCQCGNIYIGNNCPLCSCKQCTVVFNEALAVLKKELRANKKMSNSTKWQVYNNYKSNYKINHRCKKCLTTLQRKCLSCGKFFTGGYTSKKEGSILLEGVQCPHCNRSR